MSDATLKLAMNLIARPSVTPQDHGCQELLISHLEPLGFKIERLQYGEVMNFWAQRGNNEPLVVFAGHTDVVPPGPREAWESDPFIPTLRDGYLYGRGAADMKSSIAAFVTAIESFVEDHPNHRGSIGLLITSDEEGPSINGTAKVIKWLDAQGIQITYCIVGEPTSSKVLGDVIKIGRRGSLSGKLIAKGVQGHVAYAHLAQNPIHALTPVLAELIAMEWDQGTADFPCTTFQISNIHSGTGAENVIPGAIEVRFNFRFSPAVNAADLKQRVEDVLKRYSINYALTWALSGEPYLTRGTKLKMAVHQVISDTLGINSQMATDGGTSDGRFLASTGAEVVELGPINATIHKVNESIRVEDLARLTRLYREILTKLII